MSKLGLFCLLNLFGNVNVVKASDRHMQVPLLETPTSVLHETPPVNPYGRSATPEMQQVAVQLAQVQFGYLSDAAQTSSGDDRLGKSFCFGIK